MKKLHKFLFYLCNAALMIYDYLTIIKQLLNELNKLLHFFSNINQNLFLVILITFIYTSIFYLILFKNKN